MTAPIAFTIYGEMASKSNSRMLVPIVGTDRMRSIKSRKAQNFVADAKQQCPKREDLPFTGPIRITIRAFYASERPDLDESALMDALQSAYYGKGKERVRAFAGVYVNDRQIKEKHVYSSIDRSAPRVEVLVEEIAWASE